MKKKLILIVFLFLILSGVLIAYINWRSILTKRKELANIQILPHFEFANAVGGYFTNDSLDKKCERTIINYFSPDCEHCQNMANSYWLERDKLKDLQLLMVTMADSDAIQKFKDDYCLDSADNIVILRDRKLEFSGIFGSAVVPTFFVYKNYKLMRKIIGETKIENLIN